MQQQSLPFNSPSESAVPDAGAPSAEPATAAAAPAPWPANRPVFQQVYGFTDPTWGVEMVAMMKETFLQHGTMIESLRRICKEQDARIRSLLADVAVRDQRLGDAMERLNNLRDVRRREKRAELEKELVLPGDPRFQQKGA